MTKPGGKVQPRRGTRWSDRYREDGPGRVTEGKTQAEHADRGSKAGGQGGARVDKAPGTRKTDLVVYLLVCPRQLHHLLVHIAPFPLQLHALRPVIESPRHVHFACGVVPGRGDDDSQPKTPSSMGMPPRPCLKPWALSCRKEPANRLDKA